MNRLVSFTTTTICILLAGCSGGYNYREPAAVDDGYETSATVNAYQAPSPVEIKPIYSTPVAGLLQESQRQQGEGDLAGAVASIERALRIEPRNAYLWNRLAHLRLEQGQSARAIELAAKSRSLAGADSKLKADNWRLSAKAWRKEGDANAAIKAGREARALGY
ncbi:MAG: tetratricopeptide repeat protein [Gammaproteobacteria bacterium]